MKVGIAFVSLLGGLACQSTLPPRMPLEPDDPRPAAWLRAHETRADARSSLRGALRLSLDAPDLRFRRPQRLAVRRPADLRLEILGLFGQVAAVLVTDGVTFQSFDAARGAVESGEVTDDLLWRIARVDLLPEEAVELLLGAPMPSHEATVSAAFARPGGGISLDLRDSGGQMRDRIDFDAEGRVVDFIRYDANERVIWHATFADYREHAGDEFAYDVHMRFPEVDAEATLVFDDASLHVDLADELFALRTRDGKARQ
jgi:hypothetical protein